MRALLFLLLLAATPVRADVPRTDDCALSAERSCPVEVLLPGMQLIPGDPVETAPDRLTVLAVDAASGFVAVDLSLVDGKILRKLPLDLGAGYFTAAGGLIAPDGRGYALHLWQEDTDLGLLFIDAGGRPLARMQATWPQDWPQNWPLEMSLAEAIMLLGMQNVLAFDGSALQGRVYRFGLRVTASDGRLVVAELEPGTGDGDGLGPYLDRRLARQIDPVGAEEVRQEGGLSAVTTWVSDGSPSRLLLRFDAGGEIAFDQRLGPERMDLAYHAARVTPDGRYLAAIRSDSSGATQSPLLLVFDAATTTLLYEAPIPEGAAARLHWLADGRIAALGDRDGAGVRVFVLDPALPD